MLKFKDRPSSADEHMLRRGGGRGSSRSPTRPSTERSSSRHTGRLSPRYTPVKSHLHPNGYSEEDGPPTPATPGAYVPPNASLRATGLVVTHNGLEVSVCSDRVCRFLSFFFFIDGDFCVQALSYLRDENQERKCTHEIQDFSALQL